MGKEKSFDGFILVQDEELIRFFLFRKKIRKKMRRAMERVYTLLKNREVVWRISHMRRVSDLYSFLYSLAKKIYFEALNKKGKKIFVPQRQFLGLYKLTEVRIKKTLLRPPNFSSKPP